MFSLANDILLVLLCGMVYVGWLRKEPYVVLFHYTEEQGYRATVYRDGHQKAVRYHKTEEELRARYAEYFGDKEMRGLRLV